MASVLVNCDGIMCENSITIELPDGWEGDTEAGGKGHWIYCAEHKLEDQFFSDVCPGCVETFKDCELAKSFMYAHRRTITEKDLETIEYGICPFRTNGTLSVISNKQGVTMEKTDLSKQAPSEAGKAVVQAIYDYLKKYG